MLEGLEGGEEWRQLCVDAGAVFPEVEMPLLDYLIIAEDVCPDCRYLGNELEALRGTTPSGSTIRMVCQDLRCLSEDGLRWILPHYLRYCLSAEGQESRMETEFLIYNLSPSEEFKLDTLRRFAFLRKDQMDFLARFMNWCSGHPYWCEYFPGDIERAKHFIDDLRGIAQQSRT